MQYSFKTQDQLCHWPNKLRPKYNAPSHSYEATQRMAHAQAEAKCTGLHAKGRLTGPRYHRGFKPNLFQAHEMRVVERQEVQATPWLGLGEAPATVVFNLRTNKDWTPLQATESHKSDPLPLCMYAVEDNTTVRTDLYFVKHLCGPLLMQCMPLAGVLVCCLIDQLLTFPHDATAARQAIQHISIHLLECLLLSSSVRLTLGLDMWQWVRSTAQESTCGRGSWSRGRSQGRWEDRLKFKGNLKQRLSLQPYS